MFDENHNYAGYNARRYGCDVVYTPCSFENEMGIKLDPLQRSENGQVTYLLARVGPDQAPVGCLCVQDTTNKHQLHEELALKFDPQARVARYTHLAVLKPYRGMNIPLAMMLEAHRTVIVPRQFNYTWLLFDVERAPRFCHNCSASTCCHRRLIPSMAVGSRWCETRKRHKHSR